MTATERRALHETPDDGAWPRLSDEQIAELEPSGRRRGFEAAEVLYREGDRPGELQVILDGKVAIAGDERVLSIHGPRRFLVITGGDGRPMLETRVPGVFAAGDVRSGAIKRVASAVGEGAMAVRFVHEYLEARAGSPRHLMLQASAGSR